MAEIKIEKIHDYVGKKFGNVTVLEDLGFMQIKTWAKEYHAYKVRCSCGTEWIATRGFITDKRNDKFFACKKCARDNAIREAKKKLVNNLLSSWGGEGNKNEFVNEYVCVTKSKAKIHCHEVSKNCTFKEVCNLCCYECYKKNNCSYICKCLKHPNECGKATARISGERLK